jgi:4-hydroxy-tetrahydrodipicolinate synthase
MRQIPEPTVTPGTETFGLSAALVLPVGPTGEVDLLRLADHARWCLAEGCNSVTAFGTTGEGVSLGLSVRDRIVGALIGAAIDPRSQILGGVAASAVEDAAAQARQLMDANVRGVLLAPPFYFKGVSDAGLFAWFAATIEKLGPQARDVILYNIPSVTQIRLSVELIGRLREAFPEVIIGVKDSSGDWPYTEELLARHSDIAILIGDERSLAAGIRRGAQGSISGLANVRPRDLFPMIQTGKDNARISQLVEEVLKFPVTPAVKGLVAHRTGDPAWLPVRPPLIPLGASEASRLGQIYDRIFSSDAA